MSDIIKPLGQNKIWASNGVFVEPSDAKQNIGWNVERPPYQWENFLMRKITQTLASFNQKGFPTWDAETEYRANGSWILGANGVVYYCKVTHTNQNPTTDLSESYWRPILTGQKLFPASGVSNYIKPFLLSNSSNEALGTLGVTTVGRNIITSNTTTAAQTALGGGSVGRSLFQAITINGARSVLEILPASESTAGLAQRASDAEAVAAVEDTKYLTPKKLKIGFSANFNSSNGGITTQSWMGGYARRWGSVFINGGQTVNLNSLFANACLNINANVSVGAPNDQRPIHVSLNGNGARLYNPDGTGVTVLWSADGY